MRNMRNKDATVAFMNSTPGLLQQEPLVSIVTPAYNAEMYLAEAIDSVIAQTYQNWEMLIVIDNKSSDKTQLIAEAASQKDSRIKVIKDSLCSSVSANRNRAIEEANGTFIAFLDSDDRWLPKKLELQIQMMVEQSINISYHSFDIIGENGQNKGTTRLAKYDVNYHDLLKNNCMGCLTVVARRSFIHNTRMMQIRHEDLHFWLQLLQGGHHAKPMPQSLAEYRIRKDSISENKLKCAVWRWQLYRHLGVSIPKALYLMVLYVLFALNKRI